MISGAGSLVAADLGGLCDQWHNGRADSPGLVVFSGRSGNRRGVSFDGSGRVLRATPRNNVGTLYGFVIDATSGILTQVPALRSAVYATEWRQMLRASICTRFPTGLEPVGC